MSSSKIILSAPAKDVEIKLRNSQLATVEKGFGHLDVDVSPGLYQVQFRAGDTVEERFIAAEPGQIYRDEKITMSIATPVPLSGTTGSGRFRTTLERLSRRENIWANSPGARLLIFICNVKCPADAASTANQFRVELPQDWTLHGADGSIRALTSGELSPDGEWLGLVMDLPPGGYFLGTTLNNIAIAQSLWLSDGWITGVFIPNSKSGPQPDKASIQMSRCEIGWVASDVEADEVSRMAELALIGLRDGRAVLPPDLLKRLLDAKFSYPILGIVGAHSLLLGQEVNVALLQTVLKNLDALIPGHPDVASLKRMAKRYFPELITTEISWPPMLAPSFRGILAADGPDACAFVAGSKAEQIAPFVVQRGIWTSWRIEITETLGRSTPPIAVQKTSTFQTWMAKLGAFKQTDWMTTLEQTWKELSPTDRAAARRILRYLREYAALEDHVSLQNVIAILEDASLGRRTGVPYTTVRRLTGYVIEELKSEDTSNLLRRVLDWATTTPKREEEINPTPLFPETNKSAKKKPGRKATM